jgi:hypothetical protein
MTQQPDELRDFLAEAEAIVTEWYSLDGVEPTHALNLAAIAELMCLQALIGNAPTFAEMTAAARVYLTAAFQIGRAGGYGNDSCATQ